MPGGLHKTRTAPHIRDEVIIPRLLQEENSNAATGRRRRKMNMEEKDYCVLSYRGERIPIRITVLRAEEGHGDRGARW